MDNNLYMIHGTYIKNYECEFMVSKQGGGVGPIILPVYIANHTLNLMRCNTTICIKTVNILS